MTNQKANNNKIEESVIVVTGVTGTVGWGFAHAASQAGAQVIAPVRTAKALDIIAREFNGKIEATVFDPKNDDSLISLRKEILKRHGKINHVFAPMGAWWQKGPSLDQPKAELSELLDTYVNAQFALIKHMSPALQETAGSYTMVTGAAGEHVIPGAGLLVVAVGAQYALSQTLRSELEANLFRLNELRIYSRIEREARSGVVPAKTAGSSFLKLLSSTERSKVFRYDGETLSVV